LAQEGITGIQGMMYTTWGSDYRFLPQFAYYSWGAGPSIYHVPFDSSVFQTPEFKLSTYIYTDPFDATDSIRSAQVTIYDPDDSSILSTTPLKEEYVTLHIYSAVFPNTMHEKGFFYTVQASNKQGLTRTTPLIRVLGTRRSQRLVIDPPELFISILDFPNERSIPITLKNTQINGGATTITSITVVPDSECTATFSSPLPITIQDSEVITLTLRYKPISEGRDSATIILHGVSNNEGTDYSIPIQAYAFHNDIGVADEPAFSPQVNIMPNPTSDHFTIAIADQWLPAQATITDVLGYSMAIPILGGRTDVPLEKWGMHYGEYLLRITTARGQVVRKLIYRK
jgi:hypothetical protein